MQGVQKEKSPDIPDTLNVCKKLVVGGQSFIFYFLTDGEAQ